MDLFFQATKKENTDTLELNLKEAEAEILMEQIKVGLVAIRNSVDGLRTPEERKTRHVTIPIYGILHYFARQREMVGSIDLSFPND